MAAGRKLSWDGPDLRIDALRTAYRSGKLTPGHLIDSLVYRMAAYDDPALWIDRLPAETLRDRAAELARMPPDSLPLYGIPFAVKDNIDVAGRRTTAACPDFAYVAEATAPAVACLIEAGAVLIGKTNMDQFATGLVGTRSPYGVPRNPVAPDCIPGGSSSGSATAVAAGLVSFALGTDTAGSGRIPAAFNNIVGLKPTKGLVSTRGVVPACRSLDCVSIFALSCADALSVLRCIGVYDRTDPYARAAPRQAPAFPDRIAGLRLGVPGPGFLEFFGDAGYAALFDNTLARLRRRGATIVDIDFSPFAEAASLLYAGPWVAERYAAIGPFLEASPDSFHRVTGGIVAAGRDATAADLFKAQHRLAALKRRTDDIFEDIDALVTPTAPTIYTPAAVDSDPVRLNSNLGIYTNFVNLLDLAAVSVPAGFTADGRPFGITLSGPAWNDVVLAILGGTIHFDAGAAAGATGTPVPSPDSRGKSDGAVRGVRLAVNGAHMNGLQLNHELRKLGATFAFDGRTAAAYRLYLIDTLAPPRPGLVRAERGGSIDLEVWDLPVEAFGAFCVEIPAPLGIGTVELDDGQTVKGFLCEADAVRNAADITEFGGWRAYLAATAAAPVAAPGGSREIAR